jgi:histidine triad (HIT) family protein
VHVVPRTKGDGLKGFFWPRTRYADGEMEAYAERIRAALAV